MRFLQRNLTTFQVFKHANATDSDGDVYNIYAKPSFSFEGNLQPFSENNANVDYGFDLRYAYVVYAPHIGELRELDCIGVCTPLFEVRAIQKWRGHYRVLLKEASADVRQH